MKKKILFLTFEFPPDIGGIATYYDFVRRALCDEFQIHVLAGTQEPFVNDTAHDENLTRFPRSVRFPLMPAWIGYFFSAVRLFFNFRPDIILIGHILPLGWIGFFFSIFGKPYMVFTHGMDISVPLFSERKMKQAKFLLSRAHTIFSNSLFTKNILINDYHIPEKKIVILYPCAEIPLEKAMISKNLSVMTIEPDGSSSIPESRSNSTTNEMRHSIAILSMARLVKRKGIDTVLSALDILKKDGILSPRQSLLYTIAGDGPERAALEKIAESVACPFVTITFLGNVSDAMMKRKLYETCDIFVLPIRNGSNGDVEGFGMVYLEANVHKKPVIGTDVGGVREAIQNGYSGIIIPPDTPETLAKTLISLIRDETYHIRLGNLGYERAKAYFSFLGFQNTLIDALRNKKN